MKHVLITMICLLSIQLFAVNLVIRCTDDLGNATNYLATSVETTPNGEVNIKRRSKPNGQVAAGTISITIKNSACLIAPETTYDKTEQE